MASFGSLIPWREKSSALSRENDGPDPFVSFRREVDRMFDDFFRGAFPPGGGMRSTEPSPSIDVEDNEKELLVTAELPGLDAKDFEVTLTGDLLTIRGEKKDSREENKGGTRYVERRFGSFSRSIRLPFEAGKDDYDPVKAGWK